MCPIIILGQRYFSVIQADTKSWFDTSVSSIFLRRH